MTEQRTFQNPILPGFYPDPSICRAGEDYYLVTSTFEYYPGMPVFHSRDLVNWRQVGYVFDRASQFDLGGIRSSGGMYAPTIRYSNGTFYLVNTLVDGLTKSGCFIVTAQNPAGPWSDPYWLEDARGFDPSLLFDEDGRAWYTESRIIFEGHYEGHTEIWLQELDLQTMQLTGEACFLWDGALKGARWAEAPHLYHVGDYYYLMIAEGGTAHHHAVTVARSKSITGPYEGYPANPVLTHRHLGLDYPIVGIGHGDLVQTQRGEWWMVMLGMRPCGGYFYNLGRETFLAPVRWEEDWPVACPGIGKVETVCAAPDLPEVKWPVNPARDDFDAPKLDLCWQLLRNPEEGFYSLSEQPGFLRLAVRPQRLTEPSNVSFVGRRLQHHRFTASCCMAFVPQTEGEWAGVTLYQNERFHFLLSVTGVNQPVIRLSKRAQGIEEILAERPLVKGEDVYLRVQGNQQELSFSYAQTLSNWQCLAEHVDARILSTPVAGGFTGALVALTASSNGQPSTNSAAFDWFEYQGEDSL